jgi:hypothetical protein
MALSDRWTREQLRSAVRRELMDPNNTFWTDTELNLYLDDWQQEVQEELEFVWGTATLTTTDSTFALTDLGTNILRPDHFIWNNVRLSPRSKNDLDAWRPYWREADPASPYVCYEVDSGTYGLWPPPDSAGTLSVEYPRILTFSSDIAPMDLPAWTRYSAINYCTYRAYERYGPNHDLNRAYRRKSKFLRQVARYKNIKAQFFPDKPLSLRPGGPYESQILNPKPYGDISLPLILSVSLVDEVPTGTINGVNSTFTLTRTPNPALSLKVWVDGVLMTQNSHYTLSGDTITFINPYQPFTGNTLFVSYRYTA